MIQVRQNVFETNSSSTHSICICNKSTYRDWVHGDKLYIISEDKFIDADSELAEKLIKQAALQKLSEYDYKNRIIKYKDFVISYDEYLEFVEKEYNTVTEEDLDKLDKENGHYWKDEDAPLSFIEYCEITSDWLYHNGSFKEEYTSEHGDEIVIFGYYGYDG